MTLDQLKQRIAAINAQTGTNANFRLVKKMCEVQEYNRQNPNNKVTLAEVE